MWTLTRALRWTQNQSGGGEVFLRVAVAARLIDIWTTSVNHCVIFPWPPGEMAGKSIWQGSNAEPVSSPLLKRSWRASEPNWIWCWKEEARGGGRAGAKTVARVGRRHERGVAVETVGDQSGRGGTRCRTGTHTLLLIGTGDVMETFKMWSRSSAVFRFIWEVSGVPFNILTFRVRIKKKKEERRKKKNPKTNGISYSCLQKVEKMWSHIVGPLVLWAQGEPTEASFIGWKTVLLKYGTHPGCYVAFWGCRKIAQCEEAGEACEWVAASWVSISAFSQASLLLCYGGNEPGGETTQALSPPEQDWTGMNTTGRLWGNWVAMTWYWSSQFTLKMFGGEKAESRNRKESSLILLWSTCFQDGAFGGTQF